MNKDKCSRCGYDKHKGSLHIHHIDGDHDNNTEDNLEVLCANCHWEHHSKYPVKRGRHIVKDGKEDRASNACKIQDLENRIIKLNDDIEVLEHWHSIYKRHYFNHRHRIAFLEAVVLEIMPWRDYSKMMQFCNKNWALGYSLPVEVKDILRAL